VITAADIVSGLRALGVTAGDVVLAHSSLKSFGKVDGGADAVINALLEVVGPGGTAMVPTLTGSEEFSPDNPPVFDVLNTPCWTGAIPETFRRRPGAARSLHPTHSVSVIGPDADFLIRDHMTCKTPCGPDSPYLRLAERDGKVVFFGVNLTSCTLLHGVEEIAGCEYNLQNEPVNATVIDEQGRSHSVRVFIHQYGTPRRFQVLDSPLLREGIMRMGHIGRSEVRVLRARPAVEMALKLLREDPGFLCGPDREC